MNYRALIKISGLVLLLLVVGGLRCRQAALAAEPGASQPAVFLPVVFKKNFDLQVNNVKVIQGTSASEDYAVYIAQRKTLVRVFIGTGSGQVVRNVTARLCGYSQDGAALGCLQAENSVQAPSVESDLARTVNFELPAGWVQPGYAYHVDVDPSRVINESNRTNNRYPAQGTQPFLFTQAPALDIMILPVRYQPYPGTQIFRPETGDLTYLTELPEKVLPVPSVSYPIHSDYFYRPRSSEYNLDNPNGSGWYQLLHELTMVHNQEDPQGTYNYFGLVDSFGAHGCNPSGCITGISNVQATGGQLTAAGWSGYGPGTPEASRTLIHELGHNFGSAHVACTGTEPKPDADYPYENGLIGVWGVDIVEERLNSPEVYADFMSYCDDIWTSDYTYWHIDAYRRSAAAERQATSPATQAFYLGGYFSPGGAVHLDPVYEQMAPVTASKSGSFGMELLGEGGRILAVYAFEPVVSADVEGFSGFGFFVPSVRGLQGLRVSRDGRILAERIVEQPAVGLSMAGRSLDYRVTGSEIQLDWGSSEKPASGVLYRLRLSIDGGRSWQVLALNLNEPAFSVPPDSKLIVPGAVLEIQATDGIHTSTSYYPAHSTFGE